MCLAVPMKIIKIEDDIGTAELGGVKRRVSIALLEDVSIGDYVLIHAGFAIEKVKEEEAEDTLNFLRELG